MSTRPDRLTSAIRETVEEKGVTIRVEGLVGAFSDPHHVVAF